MEIQLTRRKLIYILSALIALLILLVLFFMRPSTGDGFRVTNITDRAASLSWSTDNAEPAVAYVVEKGILPFRIQLNRPDMSYDDRDLASAELANARLTDVASFDLSDTSVRDINDFRVHQLQVKNLKPGTDYDVYISKNRFWFEKNPALSFRTKDELEDVELPVPLYGYLSKRVNATDFAPATDAVVYMRVKRDGNSSDVMSAVTNSDGAYYIDLATSTVPWSSNSEVEIAAEGGSDGVMLWRTISAKGVNPMPALTLEPNDAGANLFPDASALLNLSLPTYAGSPAPSCGGDATLGEDVYGESCSNGCEREVRRCKTPGGDYYKVGACDHCPNNSPPPEEQNPDVGQACEQEYSEERDGRTFLCRKIGVTQEDGSCSWGPGSNCQQVGGDTGGACMLGSPPVEQVGCRDKNACASRCANGQSCVGGNADAACCTGNCENIPQEPPNTGNTGSGSGTGTGTGTGSGSAGPSGGYCGTGSAVVHTCDNSTNDCDNGEKCGNQLNCDACNCNGTGDLAAGGTCDKRTINVGDSCVGEEGSQTNSAGRCFVCTGRKWANCPAQGTCEPGQSYGDFYCGGDNTFYPILEGSGDDAGATCGAAFCLCRLTAGDSVIRQGDKCGSSESLVGARCLNRNEVFGELWCDSSGVLVPRQDNGRCTANVGCYCTESAIVIPYDASCGNPIAEGNVGADCATRNRAYNSQLWCNGEGILIPTVTSGQCATSTGCYCTHLARIIRDGAYCSAYPSGQPGEPPNQGPNIPGVGGISAGQPCTSPGERSDRFICDGSVNKWRVYQDNLSENNQCLGTERCVCGPNTRVGRENPGATVGPTESCGVATADAPVPASPTPPSSGGPSNPGSTPTPTPGGECSATTVGSWCLNSDGTQNGNTCKKYCFQRPDGSIRCEEQGGLTIYSCTNPNEPGVVEAANSSRPVDRPLVSLVFEAKALLAEGSISFDPNAGKYLFEKNGYYQVDYQGEVLNFVVTDSSAPKKVFYDRNSNSALDTGEEFLDLSVRELQFSRVADAETVDLYRGYNFLSFNMVPQELDAGELFMASTLLRDLNSRYSNSVTSLAKYESGQWVTVVFRNGEVIGSNDFQIVPGRGYVLKSMLSQRITVSGFDLTSPVPVVFNPGWNLVGIHGTTKSYTAESFIDELNATEIEANNVTKWDAGIARYQGLVKEKDDAGQASVFGFDFPLLYNQGYFVKILGDGGEWSPSN